MRATVTFRVHACYIFCLPSNRSIFAVTVVVFPNFSVVTSLFANLFPCSLLTIFLIGAMVRYIYMMLYLLFAKQSKYICSNSCRIFKLFRCDQPICQSISLFLINNFLIGAMARCGYRLLVDNLRIRMLDV